MNTRPLHEILAAAKPYLFHPDTNRRGQTRICYALIEAYKANDISDGESAVGEAYVQANLQSESFLEDYAKALGHVRYDCSVYDEEYIAFRDRWLDELIERSKTCNA